MSKALYRKYRSKSLVEILGQSHVTDVLKKALEQGKIAHAYLLTGPRGVGKTSIARILAHEINQLPYEDSSNHLDIIEIDAASNNGVEDVRDLRDKVQIAPVSAVKKVYIIDEVHMLSKAAFNALLKTLEEPPEHIVFILATTDVEKLPATIVSRTQRFSLRAIPLADIVQHLKHIAKEEKLNIADDAIELIAQRGDGSFRDSISLLDQLSSVAGKDETITLELVEQALGLAPRDQVLKLLEAYEAKDLPAIISTINESEAAGVQPSVLTDQLLQEIRAGLFEKPQLLPLMDALLEVPKSSQPGIKLLTVLAAYSPKPKNAALSVPSTSVSASVKELRATAPNLPKQAISKLSSRDISQKHTSVENTASASGLSSRTNRKDDHKGKKTNNNLTEIDWPKLVDYTRQHFVAIYSVLLKCGHEIIDGELTIYTGNAFYKKKLDDTKYSVNLAKSLSEIGIGEMVIHTVPTPPPPKDSLAASVAAIMGGGEEVSVGEEVAAS